MDVEFLYNFSKKDIDLIFNITTQELITDVDIIQEPINIKKIHSINANEIDEKTFDIILGMFLLLIK